MISINIQTEQFQKHMNRFPSISRSEIVKTLETVVQKLESDVQSKTPVGVGGASGLKGSISGEVVDFGRIYTGRVATSLAYAKAVEFGRQPGSTPPPVAPLALWIQRKSPTGTGASLPLKQARGIAFYLSRKIGRRGFSPRGSVGPHGARMFEKSFKQNEPWVRSVLRSLPDSIIRRLKHGA